MPAVPELANHWSLYRYSLRSLGRLSLNLPVDCWPRSPRQVRNKLGLAPCRPNYCPLLYLGQLSPSWYGPEALEAAGAWAKTTGTNAPTHNASDPARNRAGNLLVFNFCLHTISLLIALDKQLHRMCQQWFADLTIQS